MSKKRILFVDDQPNVLSGLRRALHSMRHEWDMDFVESGEAALQVLSQKAYDVVVSDMMMPKMNGAQLLREVSERYPGTIRFILSGHSDRELILQSVGFAHRYIAKPCQPEVLKSLLNNSVKVRQTLSDEEIHNRIAMIGTLPSPPEVYYRLVEELQSENPSMKKIADLIAHDVSMTAKLLQMVNSAFFGLPTRVESPLQAVNLLGLDTVQGLVLVAGAFSQFQDPGLRTLSVEGIYSHSLSVGNYAKDVARELGLSKRQMDDAMMAGMLHDIGKVILLAYFHLELQEVLQLAQESGAPMHEVERQILGLCHAEMGAHLLSLWGLPDSILEAVAFHHAPEAAPDAMVDVLTAVHIANALDHMGVDKSEESADNPYSTTYLESLGLAGETARFESLIRSESVQEA